MNTPLTDAAEQFCYGHIDRKWTTAEFARDLEIQLGAEKSAVAYLNQIWNEMKASRDRAMEELACVKLRLNNQDAPQESETPLTDDAALNHEVVTAVFARNIEMQLRAADKVVAHLKGELAFMKLQRDKLLEITWLDTPAEPHESTKRWAEEFEKGWVRR